ncbi:MAG: family ATPase [Proteobacteria bacterium]|nr:family ATPase [Pseudomonadota bacterium]
MNQDVMDNKDPFIARFDELLTRLNHWLPDVPPAIDWTAQAFRWRSANGHGYLQAVAHPHRIGLDDLAAVDQQKQQLFENTRQFVAGRSANNVLLTGARGTGKSSLIKAVWQAFRDQDLRLIEVEKVHLVDLPDIIELVYNRPERFIIFCDDLSFEEGDHGYQALKTVLDGSIAASSSNVLIYATSNRRHLVPEYFSENAATRHVGEEVHFADAVEEKMALSERFGLWLTFYAMDQDAYLAAAQIWLAKLGFVRWDETVRHEALQWSRMRGARSGRVAWQFARDRAGRLD